MGKKYNNPQIAFMVCPICDQDKARVHAMKRKNQQRELYYFNCDHCGCIQGTGPVLQKYIRDQMVRLDPKVPEEPTAARAESTAPPLASPPPKQPENPSPEPEEAGGGFANLLRVLIG